MIAIILLVVYGSGFIISVYEYGRKHTNLWAFLACVWMMLLLVVIAGIIVDLS